MGARSVVFLTILIAIGPQSLHPMLSGISYRCHGCRSNSVSETHGQSRGAYDQPHGEVDRLYQHERTTRICEHR